MATSYLVSNPVSLRHFPVYMTRNAPSDLWLPPLERDGCSHNLSYLSTSMTNTVEPLTATLVGMPAAVSVGEPVTNSATGSQAFRITVTRLSTIESSQPMSSVAFPRFRKPPVLETLVTLYPCLTSAPVTACESLS